VAQAVSGADLPAVLAAFVTATDAPVAIAAVTDGGFPLVYVNAAFEQTFGAVALATTGSPAPDPQALGLRQVVEAMGHASESGRPAHPRLSHPGPGGRTGWYDMTITPVGDGSGRVTHVVCLAHDVTDLGLADAGRRRVQYAERAMPVLARLRDRFAAERPLAGLRIAACAHVTPETAALARTLTAGGAALHVAASNPLSTQDDVAAALVREDGVGVQARQRLSRVRG